MNPLKEQNAQGSLEYILILGGVIVIVLFVIWTYMEIVKSAGTAFVNSTEMILNQTMEEMKEWLEKL
jgi:uncharacterized protein (UPF0333 family)